MSKNLIKIQQSPIMSITWIINNICNNRCSYCPPELNSGKNHHYEWESAREFILRLFEEYPKIHCSISGGEPTLSPFFTELVDIFYNSQHTVGITTNGARTVRYWEEISPKLSYICFSYHPSHEDLNFLEKVKVASKQTLVTVRIMMDSRHWDKSVEMYRRCCEMDEISVEPVRILPEMARAENIGEKYTEEQEKILLSLPFKDMDYDPRSENPNFKFTRLNATLYYDDGSVDRNGTISSNRLITEGKNKFTGWRCAAGLESLFISQSGHVKIANCLQGGFKFHINDHKEYELPKQWVTCNQPLCFCGTDFLISKEKINDKSGT